METYHYPVLEKEVLNYWINPKILANLLVGKKIFLVDATCGEGGHSLAILKKAKHEGWLNKLKLICLDADKEILGRAQTRLKEFSKNIIFANTNFINLTKIINDLNLKKVDGILFDLGISTFHYKISGRGFSFAKNEILDMRIEKNPKFKIQNSKLTIREILNNWSEEELRAIFKNYGEEKWAKRIAQKIVAVRVKKEIKTSFELAEIVARAIPKKFWPRRIHPATRVFQALRIVVNSELENLQKVLIEAKNILNSRGRILVISFHSLEDRIVKKYFRKLNLDKRDEIYGKIVQEAQFDILTKKPILVSSSELVKNPASRSAKLRIIEKR